MPIRPNRRPLLAILAVAAMTAPPAAAQDVMDQAIDQSTMAMSLYAGSIPIEEDVRRSLRCGRVQPLHRSPACDRPAPPATPGRGTRPKARPAATAPASLRFQSTPALRRAALDQMVARIAAKNPANARALDTELSRHDYDAVYRSIVAPFGLRADDAGDALAAYLLLGWMIANGSGDPSAADVRGVRAQVGAALPRDPRLADPAGRATMGETFKIQFVTLHAGWQAARHEGTLARYAEGVAQAIHAQSGIDMRATQLAGGFVPRR